MKCVEFSNVPPNFEVCNTADGKCIVRFYCDIQEIARTDGESELPMQYKAACYEIKTNRSSKLESRIENNYEAWLQKAQSLDRTANLCDAATISEQDSSTQRIEELEAALVELASIIAEGE